MIAAILVSRLMFVLVAAQDPRSKIDTTVAMLGDWERSHPTTLQQLC
jgi:hypothetical protein